jgi:uncharacterized protein (TIGR00255 family)
MVQSMTAFTRQQIDKDYGSLAWEIRSVNHRYLEASVRVPESFRALENTVREALRKQLNRGKVECQLRFQTEAADGASVGKIHVDTALVKQLLEAGDVIGSLASDVAPLSTAELLRWPGVIGTAEIDKQTLENDALELFVFALNDLIATRETRRRRASRVYRPAHRRDTRNRRRCAIDDARYPRQTAPEPRCENRRNRDRD